MEDRIKKIKSLGYWRILIRPILFQEDRIKSLQECKDIIYYTKVSLRGWDFPHLDKIETVNGIDCIQSGAEFHNITEFWKFFQSAQFIYLSSIREDYMINDILEQGGEPIFGMKEEVIKKSRFLNIEITIYRITEVFEFTSRLVNKNILEPSFEISIELFDVSNRILFFFQRDRDLRQEYKASIENIPYKKTFKTNDFLANSKEYSVDCISYFFERFNCYIGRGILKEIQSRIGK